MAGLRIVEWIDSIFKIPPEEWDALAAPRGNPAMAWGYLAALEETGSVAARSGWVPHHYVAREAAPERSDRAGGSGRGGGGRGRILACAPVYIRDALEGEFVFDYAFWEAAERLGRAYFPRLVAMAPLTPTRSFSLLGAPENNEIAEAAAFLAALEAEAAALGCASANINHPDPAWTETLRAAAGPDWGAWKKPSFYFDEPGLRDFDGYLDLFDKNQRRNIRRERASLASQGIRVATVPGAEATPRLRARMWDYYLATNDKFGPWAARFLEPGFFDALAARLPAGHLYFAAYETGRAEPLGLALCLEGGRFLLGRYWGAARGVRDLHFNLCYYAPVRHLCEAGPRRFDPGMGGEHKARRGFRSEADWSFHYFRDPLMRRLLGANLPAFNAQAEAAVAALNAAMPLRAPRTGPAAGTSPLPPPS